jgi:cystathionine beta-lyase
VVIEALHQRVNHRVFGYTRADDRLAESIVSYLVRQHGATIDASWLVWLPGCVPALSMGCNTVGASGDRVLTTVPVYPPFLHVHRDSGKQLTTVPLAVRSDQRHELDWDALERAVTADTRVFLFCNPHNPVGRAFPPEDVERVLDFCHRHDLLLCSDEIHCDLILDDALAHTSVLRFDREAIQQTVTLMAASKTYNIAGLACAFAVIPDDELRRRFRHSAGKLLGETNPLGLVATKVALDEGEPWRRELIAYLRLNRNLLSDFVARHAPRIRMTPLEATYLAWLDVREISRSKPRGYIEEHGVGLSDGADFGTPGFLRLNFGLPRFRLEEALRRLEHALESLGTGGDTA